MFKKYIGDKKFYKMVLAIALPIMLQNAVTNFVNMLDNIMIGRVGTMQMTGVAIANQLIFIFNLCIFGALSGAGIFSAQFYGKGDTEGVRVTLRFKLMTCAVLVAVGVGVFLSCGNNFIMLYLKGEGSAENAMQSLAFGNAYLKIMLISFLPYAIAQAYASSLRETGETVLPMIAGMVAVIVNLALNYVLIYGHFGAPKLGVEGAAIATLISRFFELAVVAGVTHIKRKKYSFVIGLYRSFAVPRKLAVSIMIKGMPVFVNEGLWSSGMAVLNQCFSLRSQDVIAAINITTTLWNVFSVAFMSIGSTVGIVVGHRLGAGDSEGAKDHVRKLIACSFAVSVVIGGAYACLATAFPGIYNATDSIKSLATGLILTGAVVMPVNSICHACYFTLRAGGKTWITFVFDSLFVWVLSVPLAFVLVRYTSLHIVLVYGAIQALDILKCVLGIALIKKGVWIQSIV